MIVLNSWLLTKILVSFFLLVAFVFRCKAIFIVTRLFICIKEITKNIFPSQKLCAHFPVLSFFIVQHFLEKIFLNRKHVLRQRSEHFKVYETDGHVEKSDGDCQSLIEKPLLKAFHL